VLCRARGLDPLATAEAVLRGGAQLLQVRGKDEPGARLLALVERVIAVARPLDARVIVNDRADIARMADADGVHVGQGDLPVDAVRAIVGPDRIIGLSTHDRDQIDRALSGAATYVAVGPVFGSETKDTGYTPRGLELVAYAAGRGKPVVAIGGITLDRAPAVVARGAAAVAVISDLLAGNDPENRARQFVAALPGNPFNV
jgi:thiamine-phosphate pyrophosphorylase